MDSTAEKTQYSSVPEIEDEENNTTASTVNVSDLLLSTIGWAIHFKDQLQEELKKPVHCKFAIIYYTLGLYKFARDVIKSVWPDLHHNDGSCKCIDSVVSYFPWLIDMQPEIDTILPLPLMAQIDIESLNFCWMNKCVRKYELAMDMVNNNSSG